MSAILALAAGLPSWLAVRHVRARLEPDPAARTLGRTFLLGAVAAGIVLALAPLLAAPAGATASVWVASLRQATLSAALPEETAKLLALALVLRTGCVADRRSGLAHGLAAALGFAAIEMALFASLKGLGTAALRTVTTLPCHAFLGCVMGSILAARGPRPGAGRVAGAFVAPVLLHAAYDFPLMVLSSDGTPAAPGTWAFATLTVLAAATLVLGGVAGWSLYRDAFPAAAAPADRRPLRPAPGLLARTLIPAGVVLASAGSWLGTSLVVVGLPSADLSAGTGRTATAVGALAAALVAFGLALGLRGLRVRRAAVAPAAKDGPVHASGRPSGFGNLG